MLRIGTAALGLALVVASPSGAADAPSLKGTWKGPSQGIGKADGWTSDEITIEITEQRGPAFTAQVVYGDQREDVIGSVAADGRTVHIVGDDGHNLGAFTAPDTLDLCYVELGADAKTACTVLKRAP